MVMVLCFIVQSEIAFSFLDLFIPPYLPWAILKKKWLALVLRMAVELAFLAAKFLFSKPSKLFSVKYIILNEKEVL